MGYTHRELLALGLIIELTYHRLQFVDFVPPVLALVCVLCFEMQTERSKYRMAISPTFKYATTRRSDSTSTVDSVSVPTFGPEYSDPSFEFNAMKRQLFKTKVCRHFLTGKCKYSTNCTFAHSKDDLQFPPDFRKSRLCQKGNCFDATCQYAHSASEIRDTYTEMCPHWLKGSCPHGTACKLSHNLSHLEEMAIASAMKIRSSNQTSPASSVGLTTPTFCPTIDIPRDSCPAELVEALIQLLASSSNLVSI